ncbi:MAG: zinc ABC transporter substrate-binding protein, partial [Pseudomonadota bacterium]|nr:zinc ABC transporter substrate-binding protein [Pseudomonadota bacterium]
RADVFADRVERRVAEWRPRLAGAPGVVLFHRDAIYLLDRFAVPLLGTVEPVPGVPPGGAHLRELITRLRGAQGVVVRAPYHPEPPARQVADTLGWPLATLPLEPPLASDGAAYLDHIERWVTALAGAAHG